VEHALTYPLPSGLHQVLDVDADAHGNYIALFDNAQVWSHDRHVHLPRHFTTPLIRAVNREQFLIVEAWQPPADNGFFFDWNGRQLGSFLAGHGIADVLVHAGRIVISYVDEGVLEGGIPSGEGVAVFDVRGQLAFGYNSRHAPFLLDCYAMCAWGPNRIVAYPYPEAPLLDLRLSDYQLRRPAAPVPVAGIAALSEYRGQLLVYVAPYGQASYIRWQHEQRIRQVYLPSTQPMRGIGEGKFLTFDARSFTIFDAVEALQLE
jgi:hypothetical protein